MRLRYQFTRMRTTQQMFNTHLSDFVLPFFLASLERDFELSPSAGDGLEFGEPKMETGSSSGSSSQH